MTTDTALILDKERQPVNIHTPESHEQAGRNALARDMRAMGITRELEYIVGRHAYLVTEYTDGRHSPPRRIF